MVFGYERGPNDAKFERPPKGSASAVSANRLDLAHLAIPCMG